MALPGEYDGPRHPDDLNDSLLNIYVNTSPLGSKFNFNSDIVKYNIKIITKVLSNAQEYDKILNACKWFYEGHVGDNELLSFVQNTVVMEILLGDKSISDVIGIGELLRNRCAYLISNDDTERENILKDFNEIYNIRSKIVHRGKSKLFFNEKRLLNKLRFLCAKVIYKEISLIKNKKAL